MLSSIKDLLSTFYKGLLDKQIIAKSYFGLVGVSYLMYFVALFGVYSVNPVYLKHLSSFMKYFICSILILRFNPMYDFFGWGSFDKIDQTLVFSAAVFLLSTSGITDYLESRFVEAAARKKMIGEQREKNKTATNIM